MVVKKSIWNCLQFSRIPGNCHRRDVFWKCRRGRELIWEALPLVSTKLIHPGNQKRANTSHANQGHARLFINDNNKLSNIARRYRVFYTVTPMSNRDTWEGRNVRTVWINLQVFWNSYTNYRNFVQIRFQRVFGKHIMYINCGLSGYCVLSPELCYFLEKKVYSWE